MGVPASCMYQQAKCISTLSVPVSWTYQHAKCISWVYTSASWMYQHAKCISCVYQHVKCISWVYQHIVSISAGCISSKWERVAQLAPEVAPLQCTGAPLGRLQGALRCHLGALGCNSHWADTGVRRNWQTVSDSHQACHRDVQTTEPLRCSDRHCWCSTTSLTYVQMTCHKDVSELSLMCHQGTPSRQFLAPLRCMRWRHWVTGVRHRGAAATAVPVCLPTELCVPTSSADRPCATRTPLSSSFSYFSSSTSFYALFFLLLCFLPFVTWIWFICILILTPLPIPTLPPPPQCLWVGESGGWGREGGGGAGATKATKRTLGGQTHSTPAAPYLPTKIISVFIVMMELAYVMPGCQLFLGTSDYLNTIFINLLCFDQCWNCRFNMCQLDADFCRWN